MPTSLPCLVMGTPEMRKRFMTSRASLILFSGAMVTGSTIMPLSLRFTRSTSSACRSIGMLRWMNPMPPCWASAMASRDSVTVSMAALTTGIFNAILRVRQVRVSASAGSTLLRAGSRSTSSNVKASGRGEFSIYQYSLSHAGASHHPLGCALAPRSNSRLQAWPQARFRRSQANLLIFVLELVELPIDAALRQQLMVRAALPQPSFMHHQNPVGALNRRKPVGHNDRRTAGDDAAESFAHAELSLRIDAGRRLVQDQKLRVVGQRPGEINELLL